MRFRSVLRGEGTEPLRNPDRGWYDVVRFSPEKDDPMAVYLPTEHSLVLLEIHLAAYREGALDGAALERISALLTRLAQASLRAILRPLYDWDGVCWQTEPTDIGVILRHIEQLGATLRAHRDVLFLLQGVLLGNWAEMHGSPLLNANNVRLLLDALRTATDSRVTLAVRTPAFWRSAMRKEQPEADSGLGVYDDALFSSADDMGTFGAADAAPLTLSERRAPKDELAFLSALGKTVPLGGETAAVFAENDGNAFLSHMDELPLTYLNAAHHADVLAFWRQTPCAKKGVFRGKPCIDAIEAKLGYRLLIESVKLKRRELLLGLRNVGSAPMYRDFPVTLLLVGENGAAELPLDTRTSQWAQTVALNAALPEEKGERRVYLRIGGIRLANDGCFDEAVGANFLGVLS